MKQVLVVCCALILFCAAAAPVRRNIVEKETLNLSAENTVIVIPADAPKTVQFAAEEMQKLLGKVFKSKVQIASSAPAGKIGIYLGVKAAAEKKMVNQKELFRDAFIIKNTKQGIFIAGIDDPKADAKRAVQSGGWANLFERATLFGVYEWLERFAGVRFYFAKEEGTIIPETKNLRVPVADIFNFPDFSNRKYSSYHGSYFGIPEPKGGKNKNYIPYNLSLYRYRMETRYVPNNHGLARLGYVYRFGKSHPEYFALMDNGKRHCSPSLQHAGSLCYSSAVREEIYQDAKSFLKGEPPSVRGARNRTGKNITWDPSGFQVGYFNIMPQDGYYACRCEKCKKEYGTGVNYATEFMWKFVADTANRLTKEGIPGYVTMMAYRPYRNVPKCDIPKNVLVMVAHSGAWSQYNPAQQKKDVEEIARWTKKLDNKVWLWNYMCKRAPFFGIPSPTPHSLKPWLTAAAPHISGLFQESETDRFCNNYLVYYLIGKFCWNSKVDLDKLIEEHNTLMFGKAAAVMAKIQNGFEDVWMKQIISRQVETALGPTVIPPSDYDLWHKIYTAEKIEEFRKLFDQAEKAAAGDAQVLKRIKLFRSEWLDPLTAARKAYFAHSDAVRHFEMTPSKPAYLSVWRRNANDPELKTVSTKVTASVENEKLKVLFDCVEPMYDKCVAAKRGKDDNNVWRDNSVELFQNPSADRKTYYHIVVSTANCLMEKKMVLAGNRGVPDKEWRSDAATKIVRTKEGFQVEILIPVKNLPGFKKEGFPVNFGRNRVLSEVGDCERLYTWSPFARGFHDLENYGTLRFEDKQDGNLLNNGDFSAPRKGRYFGKWYGAQKLNGKQSFGLDTGCFFIGPQSMKLVNETGKDLMIAQYFKLEPDTEYTVSCQLKLKDVVPLVKGGGVCVNINAGGNLWFPTHHLIGTSKGWIHLENTFRTPKELKKDAAQYIRLRLFRAKGTVWFDDVRLVKKNL